jgi:hypothetical protein
MGSQDKPADPIKAPLPPTEADAQVGADLEKSLLKRRKGMKESYLTKGQKAPSMLSKGQLGTGNQL